MTLTDPIVYEYVNAHPVRYCGPSGPLSFNKIIKDVSDMIRRGIESEDLPESPLIATLANRVTGRASRDTLIQIESKKGSGKSTLACEIGYQLSKALARRIPGTTPDHFFSPASLIVLNDIQSIFERLQSLPEHSIVVLDDLGISANSRESLKSGNIGLGNILAISRTMRWTIITTSPLRSQTDKNVRVLSDYVIRPQRLIPYVKHGNMIIERGFNIAKVYSTEINPMTGVEYISHIRSKTDKGKMKQVRWHVFLMPPASIVEPYEKARAEATRIVMSRTASQDGDFNKRVKDKRPRAEVVLEEKGDELRELRKQKKKFTVADIAAVTGQSISTSHIIKKMLDTELK